MRVLAPFSAHCFASAMEASGLHSRIRRLESLRAKEKVWAETSTHRGIVTQRKGRGLQMAPVPGSRAHSDLSICASDGAQAMCWFVIFNPFNNSSWVVFSTFIFLREGKNLSNLPEGKNALLIMSRPEFRPKSTCFQSTHSFY